MIFMNNAGACALGLVRVAIMARRSCRWSGALEWQRAFGGPGRARSLFKP